MKFQIHIIVSAQHHNIHDLIFTAGQFLCRLNDISMIKYDFHPKCIAKQPLAFIDIIDQYSDLKNAFCYPRFVFHVFLFFHFHRPILIPVRYS